MTRFDCFACGEFIQTPAAAGSPIKCPACGVLQAVPRTSTVVPLAAADVNAKATTKLDKFGYQAPANRETPGLMILLLDHSSSMTEPVAGSPRSKREALALAINRFLSELLLNCQPICEVRHFFDVGVISYTTDTKGAPVITSALKGPLAGRDWVSTVELERHPLRIDETRNQVDDGVGGLTEVVKRVQVWYEAPPDSEMNGAPTRAALLYVTNITREWCKTHCNSFPPVVILITGGESTDGNPEEAANLYRSVSTADGRALLFTCPFSKLDAKPMAFPANASELPADPSAHMLFRMSSEIPWVLREWALRFQINMPQGARGMAFNADPAVLLAALGYPLRGSAPDIDPGGLGPGDPG
jgi:hypothetical protein